MHINPLKDILPTYVFIGSFIQIFVFTQNFQVMLFNYLLFWHLCFNKAKQILQLINANLIVPIHIWCLKEMAKKILTSTDVVSA